MLGLVESLRVHEMAQKRFYEKKSYMIRLHHQMRDWIEHEKVESRKTQHTQQGWFGILT